MRKVGLTFQMWNQEENVWTMNSISSFFLYSPPFQTTKSFVRNLYCWSRSVFVTVMLSRSIKTISIFFIQFITQMLKLKRMAQRNTINKCKTMQTTIFSMSIWRRGQNGDCLFCPLRKKYPSNFHLNVYCNWQQSMANAQLR